VLLDLAWRLGRPLLFSMDAERAHRAVLGALGAAPSVAGAAVRLLGGPAPAPRPVRVGPLVFPQPVGLAAGLDKDGEAIAAWPALGFGFVELGTVTPRPQPGNPLPRLFRLVEERGLVNRMGFNNGGAEALAARLGALAESGRWPGIPVGANIGKNKDTPNDAADDDYLRCVELLRGRADWFTVNVSSPNTPGLRDLQAPARLGRLLDAVVRAAAPTPVFLKLAPDLDAADLAESVGVAGASGCAAVILGNTTLSRPGTAGRLGEAGGLSGAPLWPLARQRIGEAVQASGGRLPVIGVGGIADAAQVDALLDLGCAAVQLYSALVFEGPGLPRRILNGLRPRGPAA
jgi:dihydroorotate dehydrogenase